jgi:hypothetical protein
MPVSEEFKNEIKKYPWVNWSELAREELLKKDIFENFIKTGSISHSDQLICDELDWYPVDWLEMKEEFIKELKQKGKKKSGKGMTAGEFDKWCEAL